MSFEVAEQFNSVEQEKAAAEMGMWVFLATEVLFFGGLLLAYTVYRVTYYQAFAQVSQELDAKIGGINTLILLTSSLFMALAVRAARKNQVAITRGWLLMTGLFGSAFLALKGCEYAEDFRNGLYPSTHPGPGGLFIWIYYAATGLHALHMTIGLGVLIYLFCQASHSRSSLRVDIGGLYWHFVDVVWVFLWPLLYLVDRHSG